jgi:branched-subunit amino acid ABC-type transport system permease component
LSRKIVKPNAPGIFTATVGKTSVLGPKFPVMSPFLLFVMSVATVGLRSAFWLKNRINSLLMMAKPEEKKIKLPLSVWLAFYCAGVAFAAAGVYGAAEAEFSVDYMMSSKQLIYALCAFAVSFTVNRHILYWSREVIIDELLSNKLDFIRSRAITFAPSAIFIWFFGAAYLQTHINRMIKKKGLASYKPSPGARAKKSPRKEAQHRSSQSDENTR